MKIKTFCLLLLLVIGQSLSLFSIGHPITPVEPVGNGNTANDPYLVESLANLYWIAVETRGGNSFLDAFFLQTQDIDAAETADWFAFGGWLPMGLFDTEPFSGTYDGGGHIISYLHIDRSNEWDVSLFGYVVGSTISNLGLIAVSIVGYEFVGGMTGEAANSKISNCFVSGHIEGDILIGGISGEINGGVIHNSYNLSHLSGNTDIGGLAGYGRNGALIANSYSAGSIHLLEDDGNSGTDPQKEVPNTRTARHNFRDRHSKENKSGDLYIGGIVGSLYSGAATTNCFWDVDKDGIEGTVSGTDNYGATGKTTEEMQALETFSSWGVDIAANENIEKGYPFLAWELDDKGEKNDPVWIIGTGAGSPVAVPLSNTALYLSFLLVGGLVVFRAYRR